MSDYGFYKVDFGYMKIGYTDGAVTSIKCVPKIDDRNVKSSLSDAAFLQIQEYLHKERRVFDFSYELHGTEFQKKVWKALCEIPYGETRSYKEVASSIGNPNASRAVGMANRSNPIWIVVPCHRVVGANGTLTGYAGGLAMKEKLIELERRG